MCACSFRTTRPSISVIATGAITQLPKDVRWVPQGLASETWVLNLRANRLGHVRHRRRAAQVARVQLRIGGYGLNGLHQPPRHLRLTQVLQHQHRRPESSHRVGDAFAHNVERRSMNGFEHRGISAFGIDVCCWPDAQASCQRGGQVAQNIGVQIRGDNGVQRPRLIDHARRHRIHHLFVPLYVWEILRHFCRDLVPHHHAVPLRVAFRHYRQQFPRPRLGQLERVTLNPLHACARHHRNFGRYFHREALMHPSTRARVLALGVLAHNHPIQILRRAPLQRRVDAGKNSCRPHVGILIQTLADLQPQSPQRNVIGNGRIAC